MKHLDRCGEVQILVKSGDHAIDAVYRVLKRRGFSTILTPDQGGWLTYVPYAKRKKFEILELPTDAGLLDHKTIPKVSRAALILNSLPAYAFEQDMVALRKRCKDLGILLINDVSGSIGTNLASCGDVFVGSFGKHKPVNMHYGGFVGAPSDWLGEVSASFDKERIAELQSHLAGLDARLAWLRSKAEDIKKDLHKYAIVHKHHSGINVIVRFSSDEERLALEKYCRNHDLPFVLCPKKIRILDPAMSIEVKRLTSSFL
ncbi:hypothetical protein GF342_02495 [Candidatus Woesearchaeota archaeon]|nr:hypothetical protein [Candidatus Woesearchaeota archaeon]